MLRTPAAEWSIPVLETARLRLRAITPADFPAYVALWADPVVTRYIGGRAFTAEETWARMLRTVGHWSILGFGTWLIEDKFNGELVGEVGLFDYRREMHPPLELPEIGWILSPARHGKGYATEAVLELLAWARERFVAPRICCIIAPENAASLRVAERCGFTYDRDAIYKGEPAIVLSVALDADRA
jgi:RimJ/RimL family protein N-acetyltransferase